MSHREVIPLGQAIEEALRATATNKAGFLLGPHEAAFVAAATARKWIAARVRALPLVNALDIAGAIEENDWDV